MQDVQRFQQQEIKKSLFPTRQTNFSGQANAYRRHVSQLAGQWPGLSYLDAYLHDDVYLQRKSYPMTVLKFRRLHPEWGYRMETFLRLETLLNWIDDDCDNLIILEDPTPNMIAEIGGNWNIDPQFWADFLMGPSWFGSGKLYIGAGEPAIPYRDDSLLEQLWPLPGASHEQEHVSFRFIAHRERKLYDESKEDRKKRSTLSDMYPIAQEARPGPPGSRQSVRVRSNLTIWRNWKSHHAEGENQQSTEPWLGVTCIQNQSSRVPVAKQSYSYIYRNFLRRPLPREKIDMEILRFTEEWEGRSQREPKYSHSLKSIYCHCLKMNLESKAGLERMASSPNALFVDLIRLVSCFWVTELESRHLQLAWMEAFYHGEIVKRRQKFLVLDIFTPNPLGGLADKVQADLITLHGVRIDMGPYHSLISESLNNCKVMGDDRQFASLINDLNHLQEAITLLEKRIERNAAFLRSISDDFEKERSDYRNKLVLILALWAWLVSPVTLTSSIMNLGRDKTSKSDRVGDVAVFWKVAVGLGVGVILLVFSILMVAGLRDWSARRRSISEG